MGAETLRLYKHAATGYVDITSATKGGFSDLVRTAVRNEAGSLDVTLTATTAAIVNGWVNECGTVEYWEDGAKVASYYVDDYSVKWSGLTAHLKCVGALVLGKTALYTGNFVNVTAQSALQTLVGAGGWTWDAAHVSGASSYTITGLTYTDKPADEAIREVCEQAGLTFWLDVDSVFNCEAGHSAVDKSLTLGVNAADFETTYAARNVINQVIFIPSWGGGCVWPPGDPFPPFTGWTFNHPSSQAIYGVRASRVQMAAVRSYTQAADYATRIFATQALPQCEMGVLADYDASLRPGLFVEVLGLNDGRTYQGLILQVETTLGALVQELRIGAMPATLAPTMPGPRSLGGGEPSPGTPGSTDPDILAMLGELRTDLGEPADLTTAASGSVVLAINELDALVGGGSARFVGRAEQADAYLDHVTTGDGTHHEVLALGAWTAPSDGYVLFHGYCWLSCAAGITGGLGATVYGTGGTWDGSGGTNLDPYSAGQQLTMSIADYTRVLANETWTFSLRVTQSSGSDKTIRTYSGTVLAAMFIPG